MHTDDGQPSQASPCYTLSFKRLGELFLLLEDDGFQIIGPTLQDRAIRYERLKSPDYLVHGYVDHQKAGCYHLEKQGDLYFGYTVPQDSWRRHLQPPKETLWNVKRSPSGFDFEENSDDLQTKRVFFGVRPCELRAIEIQDQIFLKGNYVDPHYHHRRDGLFLVVVHCIRATSTCFCTSMGVQPFCSNQEDQKSHARPDLALTEIEGQFFLVRPGTHRGAQYLNRLELEEANPEDLEIETRLSQVVQRDLKRNLNLNQDHLKEIMDLQMESPYWNEVAQRCLSCANCTLVCPTCFCSTTEDLVSLDENTTERIRKWDSCFHLSHSYIHGGSVRSSVSARYRQWITHKLVTWKEQFNTEGCVGCGRCITWCPVGIDIRSEANRLRSQWRGES